MGLEWELEKRSSIARCKVGQTVARLANGGGGRYRGGERSVLRDVSEHGDRGELALDGHARGGAYGVMDERESVWGKYNL